MTEFRPTPEQDDAVMAFDTGEHMKVNAYAGTGKTSTLTLMANATDRLGTYLAFNKSIATEAGRKFPGNVSCSTVHSLAFKSVIRQGYEFDKMTSNLSAGIVEKEMKTVGRYLHPTVEVSARGWAYLIAETVRRFMRSKATEVKLWHVPSDGALGFLKDVDEDAFARIAREIMKDAKAMWSRMSNAKDPLPLSHDGYLKLWALSRPTIPGSFIMLDEAQDTNGVVMGVIEHQSAQLVCVGDRHQQIYEWRGARNAMTELPCTHEVRLTTSFRFGEKIAENASEYLALLGETVPLRGNPARESIVGTIEDPNTILCRNNATLIDQVIGTLDKGQTPFLVGGAGEVLAVLRAAERLMKGQQTDHPDFIGFRSWQHVEEVAQKIEGKEISRWVTLIKTYGVPYLKQVMGSLPNNEMGTDVTLSTGHKSKGMEWDKVSLKSDFLRSVDVENGKVKGDMPSEMRLLYVAATRAMEQLEIAPDVRRLVSAIKAAMTVKKAAA